MLDAIYLILVFASNDEAVNSLAAEITEISAANKLKFSNFSSQWIHCFVIWSENQYQVNGIQHRYGEKKYNNTQYFAKFSLFFESFATKKLTRKQVKISNFIVM